MKALAAAAALAVFLLATPPPAGAQPRANLDLPVGVGAVVDSLDPTPRQAIREPTGITDTLSALDRLHGYGYSINSPARAERAIKAWQRSNGLAPDGLVGPKVLASLGLSATASVPAVRVDPPVSAAAPLAGDVEAVIREVWPDALEDRAVAIATRESRLQPGVRNACCFGLFQIHWGAHHGWLAGMGITSPSQLFDARTNAEAAYALYQRDGGWGPWSM